MKLEEAIENTKKRISRWENIAEIGKASLSKEEYENSQKLCDEEKRLIEELEHLQKKNEEYSNQLDLDYVDKNFVSKDKIREKIEERKQWLLSQDISYKDDYVLEVLQDLLKEE